MAKKAKGNRIQVILECIEHKESGMRNVEVYYHEKQKKHT